MLSANTLPRSKGWFVSGKVIGERLARVRFVVYDPPAVGLPWLSVCLGPDNEVISMKPFDSAEAAKGASESCANRLARKYENAQILRLAEHAFVH